MSLQLQIIKRADHVSTRWSGGTTTQLFIYPPGADYAKRDFDLRISTATVEAERSDFTSLPGFQRKLMILEGSLHIHHKEKYSRKLEKFEQDFFEGAWQTSAEGKATDFNLMMAPGVEGALESLIMESGTQTELPVRDKFYIYVHKGLIELGEQKANEGDFVCVEGTGELLISATERSELVFVSIGSGA
jgi:environmental stress-induced protein Ves